MKSPRTTDSLEFKNYFELALLVMFATGLILSLLEIIPDWIAFVMIFPLMILWGVQTLKEHWGK